jgi:hypothetical protein
MPSNYSRQGERRTGPGRRKFGQARLTRRGRDNLSPDRRLPVRRTALRDYGGPQGGLLLPRTVCQTQSGAAFSMAAVMRKEHLRLTKGVPESFLRAARLPSCTRRGARVEVEAKGIPRQGGAWPRPAKCSTSNPTIDTSFTFRSPTLPRTKPYD